MAELPRSEDIDAMVELIGGPNAEFDNLPPAIAEVAHLRGELEDANKHLSVIADWFRCSKTYEGR
jgi:hypothetical protein